MQLSHPTKMKLRRSVVHMTGTRLAKTLLKKLDTEKVVRYGKAKLS